MPDRSSIVWPVWATSPLGRYVLDWEQAQLDPIVSNIFGYHAVQLGLPQLETLRENRMPCRTLALDASVSTRADPEYTLGPTLQCAFPELPFATQSVGLLVLPHTLELTRAPHQLLREAARALLPEGHLVILGFNAYSLWGLWHAAGRRVHRPLIPVAYPWVTLARLKDWLKLLGFELNQGRFGLYSPPCQTERWLRRAHVLEAAGHRWWPIFGAVYILTAVKRVRCIRLIGVAQSAQPSLLPAPSPVPSPSQTIQPTHET